MSAPVLYVNQIALSSIIAASEEPKGSRRDIGNEAQGSDGSTRITRQTRKRDLKFRTVQLTEADAQAWEMLLSGEGETWNFDAFGLYGSKGMPPATNVGPCTTSGTTPKFTGSGAGKLIVPATTGSITYSAPCVNSYGNTVLVWTVLVWFSTDNGSTYHHYIVRGTGTTASAKWVDGVRNDAASTTWLSIDSSGKVTLANTTGTAMNFDDLVVLPFWIIDAWAPQLGVMTVPFSPLPYLDLSGTWVPEQSLRRVYGAVDDSRSKVANGAANPRAVRLDVDLKAK